ncbi:hypothetical protein AB9K24_09230 [Meridianimaribacter flavus]
MKKAIIIALALVAFQANAQERKKDFKKGERKERMEMMKDLTPEEFATLQTKRMTLELDLTEKQQEQMQAIHLEEAQLRKAQMEERQKLKDSDDAEKPSKDEMVKRMSDRLDHQIEVKQKVKNILNAEQFEKWEESKAKHKDKRGKRKMMKKEHNRD